MPTLCNDNHLFMMHATACVENFLSSFPGNAGEFGRGGAVAPVMLLALISAEKQEGVVAARWVCFIMQLPMHMLFTNCALSFATLKPCIGLQATPPLCPS